MKLQWHDDTDAFYDGCFSYLKAKFPNKRPKISGCEKYTEQPIYNETVVALEQIHHVLRRIEDRSAYTRKDYDDAQDNDDLKIKIINFYKVLSFNASDEMANAFQNFAKHYYWDSRIYYYKKFLHSPVGLQDLDFADQKIWSVEKFDTGIFFDFLDRYSAFLESASNTENEEFKKFEWFNRKINEQNRIYESLLFSYDQLLTQKIKFGICNFDVRLPIQLEDVIHNYQSIFSAKFLGDFGRYIDNEFAQDDGVLLVVNHAHVLSLDYVSISFLVIYKIKNYESQEKLVEHYSKRIQSFVGTRSIGQIRVTNCEKMIKKTYPSDHFVGELVGQKQKIDFRDKFLKFFVSSVFLLNVDSEELLKEHSDFYSVFFNDFRYFQEKIYIQPKTSKVRKSLFDQPNTKKVWISDLLDEQIRIHENKNKQADFDVDKYFYLRDLDPLAIQRIKLIEFLYHQQATVSKRYASLLADFIRVEKFLTRLMFLRRIEVFYTDKHRKEFSLKPSFSKLNVLFQQFILITEMSLFLKANHLLRKYTVSRDHQFKNIGYRAISFLETMREILPKPVGIDEIQIVEDELKNYQRLILKDLIKRENEEFKKAKKREESIHNYLELVFKENLIVLRFIFEGGFVQGSEDKAKVFDSMFRDYVDNLKRRYTQGVRLIDHVGLYVPYQSEHYIDATLFFKNDINQKVNSTDLIKDVSEYWSNYVARKSEQIQTFNLKQKKNNKTNPFDDFTDVILRAKSVKVIQMAGELHDEYLEVFPNQRKNKQLLMESISKFYAYGSLILVDDGDRDLLPRKDCLIVGRKRKSQKAKDKKEGSTKLNAGEASGHKSDIQIPTLSNVETSAFETPKLNEQYCTEDGSVDTSGCYENSSNMLALEQDKKILEPIPSVAPEIKAEQADISKKDVGNKFIEKTVIVPSKAKARARARARAIAKPIVK